MYVYSHITHVVHFFYYIYFETVSNTHSFSNSSSVHKATFLPMHRSQSPTFVYSKLCNNFSRHPLG